MDSELIHSSARVLEFESLREILRGYSCSPLGQERIAALVPSIDRQWIESQQELAHEIREFRRVGGRFDFSGLSDVALLVEKSRIAGVAYCESRYPPGLLANFESLKPPLLANVLPE